MRECVRARVSTSTEPTVYVMFNRAPCDEFRAWLVTNGCTHVHATTFHKLAFDAVSESGATMERLDTPPKALQARAATAGVKSVAELVAAEWYQKARMGDWTITSDAVLHWMATASELPELLETPSFQRLRAARRLYVDEAQDCSESMVRIIQGCTQASVVLAGDTNQDINGFMGAVDPVGNRARYFPGASTFPLSTSWRFHGQIATAFNSVTAERCIGRQQAPDPDRGPVIVLCATNKDVDAALEWFGDRDIKAFKRGSGGEDAASAAPEGVQVSTVHKAKGGGWHTVVVMRLRRGDVKLAATAVSRARERLWVHFSLVKDYGIKTSSHVRRFGQLDEVF
jgi:superfamily I DNA/RNA helicase